MQFIVDLENAIITTCSSLLKKKKKKKKKNTMKTLNRGGGGGSHIDMVCVYVPAFWGAFLQNLV